jgi:hypothetical protein
MYEQYPVADTPQAPERTEQPPSVRNAVRLMYAGAALEVVAIIWLVGLAAIILLFSKESGPFFSRPASR